jgi:hypothetical protein
LLVGEPARICIDGLVDDDSIGRLAFEIIRHAVMIRVGRHGSKFEPKKVCLPLAERIVELNRFLLSWWRWCLDGSSDGVLMGHQQISKNRIRCW